MAHYPGAGVGGHCIPVDPYYLIEYAKQNGFNHKFLAVAREINNAMPQFVIDQLKESFLDTGKKIEDSKVTVLGLSYKANVGDVRESPAIEIIKLLRKNHMQVAAYDPYVDTEEYAPKFHGSPKILIKNTLLHAVTGANAIIIATAHREFLSMDIQKIAELNVRAIIDGRNCLHKDEVIQTGMIYKGIGR